MADRDTSIPGNQIQNDSVKQDELDITNVPTDGEILKVNMPTGDFTAVGLTDFQEFLKAQDNMMLNAFRIAINGSLTRFNMIDGILDEYEDENSIDNPNSTNEDYDSTNDLYTPGAGAGIAVSPFAHYKCNDNAANTTVTDDGTGANNGTGNVNTSNYSVSGQINNAFEFNGTSEYVNIDALEVDIDSDTSGSFSFWFKSGALDTTRCMCSLGDADAGTYIRIGVRSDDKVEVIFPSSGVNQWRMLSAPSSLTTNTWYYLVITQDGTSPKMYLNSVDVTDITITTDITFWFADITAELDSARIGCQISSGGNQLFFDGQIDDFRYYQNKALNQTEIDAIYNSGTGTEEDQPGGGLGNMTLISDPFTAEAQPDNARIVLFEEDVDSVTENTDLKAFISRDSGQTFTTDFASDDKLDITSHGFSNTDRIMVTSSSQDLPAGLDSATVYYVINAGTNDFELSLTSGGSAVELTDNGTGTHTAKQVNEVTLSDEGDYETGKRILSGSVDISGQPSGTSMEYNLVTANEKDLKIHGAGLSWD